MPKLSGNDILSTATEKNIKYTLLFSFIAILSKYYNVPFNSLEVFSVKIPEALIDTVLLILIASFLYSLIISWIGDLLGFRLWYNSNSIVSEFGTELKLDKYFIRGSLPLLEKLYLLEKNKKWPTNYDELDDDIQNEFRDFKTNIKLYTLRLEHAGTKFSALGWYAKFYIFIQSLLFPLLISLIGIYFLITQGSII